MGRHRRSAAGRATTDRATGTRHAHGSHGQGHAPQADAREGVDDRDGIGDRRGIAPYLNPDLYAEATARAQEYLFATDGDPVGAAATVSFPAEGYGRAVRPGPRRRRRRKAATPVRTGLLGVSAAVALGTVAVTSGAIPGLPHHTPGGSGGGADRVRAASSPSNGVSEQGGASAGAVPDGRVGASGTGRGAGPSASTAPSAPASASAPVSATPSPVPTAPSATEPATAPAGTGTRAATPAGPPPGTATSASPRTRPPVTGSSQTAAEAQVLVLVNQERAKAGCGPVAVSGALTSLAEDFSRAMADQGFFDHTDPSGASPWDRAARAGITDLGGENIARGQADPAAVMDAWMHSPGHRANILNCAFTALGVGVHYGPGGPWWTQDFGY